MDDERQRLSDAIAALEGQRAVLGDAVVDVAVAPLRERLGALAAEPPEEQRKLVTVLFADLAGFTAMSEAMDPEDVKELTAAYFSRWSEVVEAHGGMVEKFIGDAVLAVFGLPVAREDDPDRAVRAALAMVDALASLNDELEPRWGRRLTMRVGINSGTALVTTLDERRGDFVVVGDVVNTASRLQSAAPLGGILVAHDTYRHVRGVFDVVPQAPLQVKGKAEPLQVYVVRGARRRAFRMGVRGLDDVDTPFLGRSAELAVLQETLLDTATYGRLRVVTVIGDPGIGKSRLLFEFDTWVEGLPERFSYFKARTSPASEHHPYSLLRDLVATRFEVHESDPPDVVRAKVEDGVGAALGGDADAAAERAHFLGHLVGFDFSSSPHVAPVLRDALQLRDRGIAALAEVLCATASRAPAVVLLEDLHWADDSSLNALADLSSRLLEHPVLVICTARPGLLDRRPNWGGGLPDSQRIDLAPLAPDDASRMVDAVLPGGVPDEVRWLVLSQAEGNPFHVEELAAMLVEDGVVVRAGDGWAVAAGDVLGRRVPPTLAGVIQARLDALPADERAALQRASVVGRTFWDDAVAHVATAAGEEPGPIAGALARLHDRDMVFESPRSAFEGTREWLFKHSLLREVTYQTVLRRDRRRYHRGAAGWLELATERAQRVGEYAAVIAEHHALAGQPRAAARWYARAAMRAAATSANRETVHFATLALDLGPADDLPWRFDLLLTRERVHDLTGDRDAQAADLDALQSLAEALGDDRRQALVWLRRAGHAAVVGAYDPAVEAAATAADLAVSAGDKALQAEAELEQGEVLWRRAEYDEAVEHLQRSRELADAAGAAGLAARALRALGMVANTRGQYLAANSYLEEALRLAVDDADERLESQVVNSMGTVALDTGELALARALYQRSLAIKRRIGDRGGESRTLHNLGVLSAEQGDATRARRYVRQALDLSRATQDAEGESVALLVLGATALSVGDHVGATTLLEQSLPLLRDLDDRQGESEALAFLALVDHRGGDHERAARRGRAAVQLARRVGTPREEFQGLTVLAHALAAQGRLDEAAATYAKALDLRRRLEPDFVPVGPLAGLARTELARGRPDAALALVREVLAAPDLADRHAFDEPGLGALVAWEVLTATGDHDGAAGVLERARRLLHERAARLDDEDRARFLGEVPAHRRLRELLGEAVGG